MRASSRVGHAGAFVVALILSAWTFVGCGVGDGGAGDTGLEGAVSTGAGLELDSSLVLERSGLLAGTLQFVTLASTSK